MKTFTKKNTLSLQKFQIAKLNNLHIIKGGVANNTNQEQNEEEVSSYSSITTDEWTKNGIPAPIGG